MTCQATNRDTGELQAAARTVARCPRDPAARRGIVLPSNPAGRGKGGRGARRRREDLVAPCLVSLWLTSVSCGEVPCLCPTRAELRQTHWLQCKQASCGEFEGSQRLETIGRMNSLSARPNGLYRGTASPQLGAGPMAGPGQPNSRYAMQGTILGARRCAGRSPGRWSASRRRPNTRPTQLGVLFFSSSSI